MQPSEPVTLAHYLSAVLNGLERDYRRLQNAWEGLNICPLGGGSMGSTSFNIDRTMTARLLGFDKPMANSIDTVASRDYAMEITSALAIAADTLSRLAFDLYIWATPEYGYIEVDDSCAVCSSIMPQKKNAFTLEHIKARAGHMHGYLMAMLSCMKTIIYSHSKDTSVEATKNLRAAMLEMEGDFVLTELTVRTMSVKRDVMLDHARRNFCTVTELANYLVRHDGISFRAAHEIVALVVDYMITHNKKANEIGTDVVNDIFMKLFNKKTCMTDADIQRALDPVLNAHSKKVMGGTAPEEVLRQLTRRQSHLDQDKKELDERVKALKAAKENLEVKVAEMIA